MSAMSRRSRQGAGSGAARTGVGDGRAARIGRGGLHRRRPLARAGAPGACHAGGTGLACTGGCRGLSGGRGLVGDGRSGGATGCPVRGVWRPATPLGSGAKCSSGLPMSAAFFGRLCQSNGRSSTHGAARPDRSGRQAARARHSANAPARLSAARATAQVGFRDGVALRRDRVAGRASRYRPPWGSLPRMPKLRATSERTCAGRRVSNTHVVGPTE